MESSGFKQPLPRPSDLAWAISYIDRLEAATGKEIWRGGAAEGNQFPWCQLPPEVDEFILGCGTRRLMRRDYDPKMIGQVAKGALHLENLDLLDTLKLMTAHIRLDRFCEGHLASALRDGEFPAVLRQLQRLVEASNGS